MSTKISTEEWLSEVFQKPQIKPANSFSLQDIMNHTGLKRFAAQCRIDEKIESGDIKKIRCLDDGKIKNFYVQVEKKKKNDGRSTRKKM